jgi:hypothetical protein
MKQKRLASSLFILLGIVLGMIPPVAYHLITTRHPPAPTSLWDSRPCRMAPGPLTCEDILPYAPSDFQIVAHGKVPGNAVCIDQKSKHYQAMINERNMQIGTITLWWLPTCQSAFAFTTNLVDLPAQMVAQLVVVLPGNRWTNAQQRETVTTARGADFSGRALWTTLVWRYPGARIAACGAVNVGHGNYSACTPFYQFG